ncbi:response regulator transcription factor [Falsibacillus pallidus]|uniref:response regulator transcription factor n=1 Tax=Falsibacillus pallidus TaxID=493781 RepID=UPI003D95BC48
MKLLIVEDHQPLLQSLKEILKPEYDIVAASDGEEGFYLASQNIYDAINLDVMLPGMNGFEILTAIRNAGIETPILFLTARDSLEDRVRGLNSGGDDYLVKPFQTPELIARLRALLRRSGSFTTDLTLKYKGIELSAKDKEAVIKGTPVKLTIKQFDLLEYLIQNQGCILTREQIYDRVWGFDSDTTIAIVEVFMHHLRKKLEPFGYHSDIRTVRGVGYILKKKQGE